MTAIARLRTSLTKSFPRLARVTNIYKRRVQDLRGPTSKGREGKGRTGRGREGRKGKGERREGSEERRGGRVKEGKGEGCVMAFWAMDVPVSFSLRRKK